MLDLPLSLQLTSKPRSSLHQMLHQQSFHGVRTIGTVSGDHTEDTSSRLSRTLALRYVIWTLIYSIGSKASPHRTWRNMWHTCHVAIRCHIGQLPRPLSSPCKIRGGRMMQMLGRLMGITWKITSAALTKLCRFGTTINKRSGTVWLEICRAEMVMTPLRDHLPATLNGRPVKKDHGSLLRSTWQAREKLFVSL